MRLPTVPALATAACFWIVSLPGPAAAALDESPCRLTHELLPSAFARCARLTVPLDYAEPNGPSLELFVVRVRSATATPEPDPLILINGGPGASAVDLYLQTSAAFERILRERDIVLLDQRGTGRSLAGLDCEPGEDFDLATAASGELRAAVDACLEALPRDPRTFTTSVAVRDLETLREALGVDEWNLYGVSYGTRVALHYLRRYPDRVRTMILDGVVPPTETLGPTIAADAQSALDAIFARCARAEGCGERFGALREQFAELGRRLAEEPVEVLIDDPVTGEPTRVELGARELNTVVRLMSYNDRTAALLPLIIDTAHAGNLEPLAAQAELHIEAVTESLGFAMHNSVVCTEDAPYFAGGGAGDTGDAGGRAEPGDLGGARAGSGTADGDAERALPYLGTTVIEGLRAICEAWPAGIIDDDFKQPVRSSRPVLLLSGEHDPVTPPANAERVIEGGLTNARHIVGRARGHGLAGIGCVPRLMAELVESADPAALDPACLDAEPPMPFFLSFQGPRP